MVCDHETRLCVLDDGGAAGAAGDASSDGDAGDGDAGMVPGCTSDNDCASSEEGPACLVDGGTCIECITDSHCLSRDKTKPFCSSRHCTPCTSDVQCPPVANNDGICVVDGHCATPDELVFVQDLPSCSGTGGTTTTPFCTAAQGVAALGGSKSVLVLRGSSGPWTITSQPAGTTVVTVIGQLDATVDATNQTVPGIAIDGRVKISIRNLHVTASSKVGISAQNGVTLFLDRCIVDHNTAGLQIDGAAFQVTNSVFANNGAIALTDGGVVVTPAIAIRNSATLDPLQFSNNTIVSNTAGFGCDAAYHFDNSILWDNGIDKISDSCAIGACCMGADPLLISDYRLMGTSPCRDQATTSTVTHDLYGKPRPSGAASDCGATEYYP